MVTSSRTKRPRAPGQAGTVLASLRDGSWVSAADIPSSVSATRLLVLVAVLVTVPLFTPGFGHGPAGIATAVALAVSAVAWLVWQFAGPRPRLWVAMLAVMALAGGALAGLSTLSTAVAVGLVVAVAAGARLPFPVSLTLVTVTVTAFLIASFATGAPVEAVIGWASGLFGFWALGLSRHAFLLRAIQAEDALEQARRAYAAETQTAALAERARIAREIHDVLAHSLAAVSVNLQAAEGLLDALPADQDEVAKAVECIQRAGALTREGMAEARRAVLALRDDEDGAAPGYAPASARGGGLAARLRTLADQHRAAGDAAVEFTVTGAPHPLSADAGLTAFRTAQEGLTNARKHAPGQPVTLAVTYAPDALTLEVGSLLPPQGAAAPLAQAGAGYGLTGLRERAALAGGTLSAGPNGGRWLVSLRIPA